MLYTEQGLLNLPWYIITANECRIIWFTSNIHYVKLNIFFWHLAFNLFASDREATPEVCLYRKKRISNELFHKWRLNCNLCGPRSWNILLEKCRNSVQKFYFYFHLSKARMSCNKQNLSWFIADKLGHLSSCLLLSKLFLPRIPTILQRFRWQWNICIPEKWALKKLFRETNIWSLLNDTCYKERDVAQRRTKQRKSYCHLLLVIQFGRSRRWNDCRCY